jgi:hypothetical protein
MKDPDATVLVPYSRFRELQQRRSRIGAKLTPADPAAMDDAEAAPPAADRTVVTPPNAHNADQ